MGECFPKDSAVLAAADLDPHLLHLFQLRLRIVALVGDDLVNGLQVAHVAKALEADLRAVHHHDSLLRALDHPPEEELQAKVPGRQPAAGAHTTDGQHQLIRLVLLQLPDGILAVGEDAAGVQLAPKEDYLKLPVLAELQSDGDGVGDYPQGAALLEAPDRKSTRLNSSHM